MMNYQERRNQVADVGITINGQKISWATVQKVRSMFRGDWDDTMDAFWKARNAKGVNGVVKYVMKGFLPDAKGVRYSMVTSKERENGQMESIRRWWNSLYQVKPKKTTMSIREIFAAIAAGTES
jgi:hypothetical protein